MGNFSIHHVFKNIMFFSFYLVNIYLILKKGDCNEKNRIGSIAGERTDGSRK